MRWTYLLDCSSETDVGSVARIQKFPSSSFGMNSPPRNGKITASPSVIASVMMPAIIGRLIIASDGGR